MPFFQNLQYGLNQQLQERYPTRGSVDMRTRERICAESEIDYYKGQSPATRARGELTANTTVTLFFAMDNFQSPSV